MSASIKCFVRDVTRSLVPLKNLGEFKLPNSLIGTPIFNDILCGSIPDGGCEFKNSVGKCTDFSLSTTVLVEK